MTTGLTITTERIDDFPLLLDTMQRLDLPAILDRHLTRHGLPQGLSWGWIATIWLAHILSQGDHRKLPAQAWVRQAGETILRITGLSALTEWDFTFHNVDIACNCVWGDTPQTPRFRNQYARNQDPELMGETNRKPKLLPERPGPTLSRMAGRAST